MSVYTAGDVSIRYEERGEGFPLLLLANGALESTVEAWGHASVNPLAVYDTNFHLVAMDQRNAGRSTGPLPTNDPWREYAQDQLALMDHLGFERFLVMGCCIGCAFALKLAEVAPERVVAAVLEQPIGVRGESRSPRTGGRPWVHALIERRSDLTPEDGQKFEQKMFDGRNFVVSVTRESVQACMVPLLVMPGIDEAHPHEIGIEVAELAPNGELVDPWKETPELVAKATEEVRSFLRRHAEQENVTA